MISSQICLSTPKKDLNHVDMRPLDVPSIWESSIYKFVIPSTAKSFKEIFIDVTRSAPTALTKTGEELKGTIDWAISKVRSNPTVLDFGAGRLRNVPYLLDQGCTVGAVEFEKLHTTDMSEKILNYANQQKFKGKFYDLMFPHKFFSNPLKFDLMIFVNVLSVMPVPAERNLVLKYCREKLNEDGLMLWFSQTTQSFYKDKLNTEHKLGDGYVPDDSHKLKTFYKDFEIQEIDELFLSSGMRLEDKKTVPHVTARLYRSVGNNPLDPILNAERIRKYVEGDIDYEKPKTVEPEILKKRDNPKLNLPNPEELSYPVLYEEALDKIPFVEKKGDKHAYTYQNLVAAIFCRLFMPPLKNLKLETKILDGLGSIDFTLINTAEHGFFHDIKDTHVPKSPYVYVECKNYKKDVSSNEFAQLIERVHDTKNHFAIMVCRKLKNRDGVLERARKSSKIGEDLFMWLDDEDLRSMLRNYGNSSEIDSVLEERVREIEL